MAPTGARGVVMKVIGFVAVWMTFWALAGLAGIGY